ncbi:hypothetical protein [Paraburkholderia sp. GAS334]|uniref:hypothetical protein n=1 Tax=Paraburkholderia sp. GAS334 TaxID=3035131 RepID=UPI003D1C595E
MNSLVLAGLIGVAVALSVALYVWNDRFRRVPLAQIGVDNVQRIGAWESPEWRNMIWSRGWMTSAEWRAVNKRQLAAIDAELKRRGVVAND